MNDLKHMKRYLTSLIIKEMQIKTTLRYHFFDLSFWQKSNILCLVRLQENRYFHILVQSLGKQFGTIHQICKCIFLLMQQPHFQEFILQMNLHIIINDLCIEFFMATLFIVTKGKKNQVSIRMGLVKQIMVHLYSGTAGSYEKVEEALDVLKRKGILLSEKLKCTVVDAI